MRGARLLAIALVAVLVLCACCSMSRRPIPGICAIDVARGAVSAG